MSAPLTLRRLLLLLAPLLAAMAWIAPAAHATSPFPVTESFENATFGSPSQWDLGGTPTSAKLTASDGTDPVGQGWLRLTSASNSQSGYVVNDTPFPSANGIDVTFDYASYGGSGADGLTFFLYDGSTPYSSFHTGPLGGSLGYASCPSSHAAGLTNGYVGIGFDEYGNFDNSSFCGQDGDSATLNPNTIVVRGAAGSTPSATGSYPLLTSVHARSPLSGNTRAQALKVNVAIAPDLKLTVYITYPDGTVQTVTNGYQLPAGTLPSSLKFGWVASTGGSTDYHEIRNSAVAEPADLQTTVLSAPSTATRGDSMSYSFQVKNVGQNDTTGSTVTATSPAGALSNVSWTCTSTTGSCGAASGTGLPNTTVDLPVGATATYTVTGQATATTNEGSVSLEADPTGVTTQSVPGDNAAAATTQITPAESTPGSSGPTIALSNTDGYTGVATATRGTYTGGGLTVTDQWQRCQPGPTGCVAIPGATSLSYTTGAADRGSVLRLDEHVSNAAGSIDDYSNLTPVPDTNLTTSTAAVTSSTSAGFALSSPTSGAAFECKLDSGAWSACTSAPTFTGLGNGSHTLAARAVYAGLSDPTPAGYTWTVDASTPVDTSTCPAPTGANGYYTTDPTCTVQGTDSVSGIDHVVYQLDGATIVTTASGTPTAGVPVTGDGTHTLRTEVVNGAGTTSGWTVQTIRIDTTAPAAPSVTAPGNGSFIADNRPGLTASAEPGSTVTFTLDGTVIAAATADGSGVASLPLTSSLTDGSHTLSLTATDAAGNVSPSSATDTFTVESSAPPAPTVTSPTAGSVSNDAEPTIAVGGHPHETVVIDLDGADYGPVTLDGSGHGSLPLSGPLAAGQHAVRAEETDQAGNVSAWSASTVWTVKTQTAVALSGPTSGPTNDTTPTVDYRGEPGDVFTITVDGITVSTGVIGAGGSGSLTLPAALRDGAHTIAILATDAAGNHATQSIVVTVDTAVAVAPTTVAKAAPVPPAKVGDGPAAVTSDRDARFTFTEPQRGGPYRYRCSLDEKAWTPCSSSPTFTGLSDGPHMLLVEAVNAAGTVSASTEYAWTVKTTPPPAPTILGGPPSATLPSAARFHVSSAPGTTLQCSLDGARYRACPDAMTLRSLGYGPHVLEVRQVDEAGNRSAPAIYHWAVLRRTGSAGLPRHAALLVAPRATSSGSRSLDVGCALDAGSIRRCSVTAYADGHAIGAGSARERHPGSLHTVLDVTLTARGQRLLARAGGGLPIRLHAAVTPYGFGRLPATNATVLFRPLRFVLRDVLFDFNSAQLTRSAQAIIAQLAGTLHDAADIVCVGNTDSIGPAAYNAQLGLRRARTVCDELHALGVHARFGAITDGASRPAATNTTPTGRHANRRVVIRVSYHDLP